MKKIVVGILSWESRLIIRKYKPFIVAVTGSVGKTSAKDAIYDALKDQFPYVRKSEKSLNSDIGLPLTVIGAPNAWRDLGGWLRNIWAGFDFIFYKRKYPSCLILEVGADHPGDIKKVAKWLSPDIAVITRISRTPVHVEFFDSPEEVFEEKAALAEAVKPGGVLVLFGDDENVLSLRERVKGRNVSVVSYGLNPAADVRGMDLEILCDDNGPSGMSMKISAGADVRELRLPGIVGETYAYPLLAAAACSLSRKNFIDSVVKSLESFAPPRGRMNLIPGINGSTLIDDSYNSSPDAVTAALSTLSKVPCGGAKIAVLGDMMELGKFAAGEHKRAGIEAAGTVSQLVTVGQRSRLTADEAVKAGLAPDMVRSFDASGEAAEYLKPIIKAGDIVLIKGSQSVRMERITAALLREPKKAAKLLVRQEKEWLAKA